MKPNFKYGIIDVKPKIDISTTRFEPKFLGFEKTIPMGILPQDFFTEFSTQAEKIEIAGEKTVKLTTELNNNTNHKIIHALKGAKVTIIDKLKGTTKNVLIEVIVEEGATVEYLTLDDNHENFITRTAQVKKDGHMQWIDCITKSSFCYINSTNLLERGSTANHKALHIGKENQKYNFNLTSHHKEGDSTSDIFTKGFFTKSSESVINGLVKIDKNARKSSGYQKMDILLHENGRANAVPNLEIDNNEVKCSHGASIGRIDEEKLFYAKSRGIKDAEELLIEAFIMELPTTIKNETIREEIVCSLS